MTGEAKQAVTQQRLQNKQMGIELKKLLEENCKYGAEQSDEGMHWNQCYNQRYEGELSSCSLLFTSEVWYKLLHLERFLPILIVPMSNFLD